PGITKERLITLTNGSLIPKTITVTPNITSSTNLDSGGMITYVVQDCAQAWTQDSGSSPDYSYSCTPGATTVATSRSLSTSADITTGSDLTASGVNYYRFQFTLSTSSTSSPGNAYGQSTAVTLSFTATARDGINK